MKTYHFGYFEIVHNYKFIEIELSDEDPQQIADSLLNLQDFVQWNEEGEITNESDIHFVEISNEQH